MAEKKTTKTKVGKKTPDRKLDAAAKEDREVKEVTTKIRNLSPIAKAEVVKELAAKQARNRVSGFTDFLREQSVIGIGIGLVLGTQVKTVVDQIMFNFVNPLTQLLPGQQRLSAKSFTIHLGPRHADINWGAIVYSVFTFIMVMIIVYATFKLLRLDKLTKKKD